MTRGRPTEQSRSLPVPYGHSMMCFIGTFERAKGGNSRSWRPNMFAVTSNFGRASVVTRGVLAGFGGTAMTAPLGPIDRPIPAADSNLPIELAQGGYRGGTPRGRNERIILPRMGGGGGWSGGRRGWGGGAWHGG